MVKSSRVRVVTIVGVVLGAWLAAHVAAGQSLGDVARREAERRKGVTGPVKVYTNDNVRPASSPPESVPAALPSPAPGAVSGAAPGESTRPAGAPAAAGQTDQAAPAAKDPREDPEYWRKRLADLRSQRDQNTFLMVAVQSRINALWTDFTARDDPAQRTVIASDRQRALAELERMQKAQDEIDKQIVDLQEEARRAKIPPGWMR
jgi:hypothetical protein